MARSKSTERDSSLLDALLADVPATTDADLATTTERFFSAIPGGKLIPLERLHEWADQPRKVFKEEPLAELAASIAVSGVLEPLIVRRDPVQVGQYIVTAGMRRLLAARRVHGSPDEEARTRVATLPCVIREAAEPEAFADALVENLVRQDLTRREVLEAVMTLKQQHGWSAREIARRTGRDSKDIAELLLVAADDEVAPLVYDEVISASAAGPLVKKANRGVRGPVLERVRAGQLTTEAAIEAALSEARLRATPTERTADEMPAGAGGARTAVRHDDSGEEHGGEMAVAPAVYGGPAVVDDDVPHETVTVRGHERRVGASSRAEALARDIIAFAAERPRLDRASLGKLVEARAALDALIASGPHPHNRNSQG